MYDSINTSHNPDQTDGQSVLVLTSATQGTDNEQKVIRIDRVPNNKVDKSMCQHVTSGPLQGIIVNKTQNGLVQIGSPHAEMDFTACMLPSNNKNQFGRREQRLLRYWFDIRELNRTRQIKQAHLYFKHLTRPEGFPRDYVSFIKKAVLLARHFPSFLRLEILFRPYPNSSDEEDDEKENILEVAKQKRQRLRDHHRKWSRLDEVSSDEEFYEETIHGAVDNHITVLTPAKYDYQYLPEIPVSNKRFLVFRVRAKAEAHIALSSVYGDIDKSTHEIVLGGPDNTKSLIRDGAQGRVVEEAITMNILSSGIFRTFWIRWSKRILEVGHGARWGDKVFLRYVIPKMKQHSVNCLAVSTGPKSHGEWEFVEKIAPEPDEDSLQAKHFRRGKVKMALLWEAKRRRLLEILGDAYPKCLNTMDLLKLTCTKMHDMMRAVMVLRDLLRKGDVLEVQKGVWMRSHTTRSGHGHVVRTVPVWPVLSRKDSPTVAIVTSLFCEKMAVDVHLNKKVTYVNEEEDFSSFTLGQLEGRCVIHIKLTQLSDCSPTEDLSNLLVRYRSIRQVFLVGVAGGVPHFSDYDQHIRLGDVVVSLPAKLKNTVYIHCKKASEGKTGRYNFRSSMWLMTEELLHGYVKKARDMASVSSSRSGIIINFHRELEKAKNHLENEEHDFTRPHPRTDKLMGYVDGELIHIEHPRPGRGLEHTYSDTKSSFRFGPVGSGKFVARNDKLRMEFGQQTGVLAYDRDCKNVLKELEKQHIEEFVLIRGISDYADGSINKEWQPHAALCAATYLKMLLTVIPRGHL